MSQFIEDYERVTDYTSSHHHYLVETIFAVSHLLPKNYFVPLCIALNQFSSLYNTAIDQVHIATIHDSNWRHLEIINTTLLPFTDQKPENLEFGEIKSRIVNRVNKIRVDFDSLFIIYENLKPEFHPNYKLDYDCLRAKHLEIKQLVKNFEVITNSLSKPKWLPISITKPCQSETQNK